MPLDLTRLMIKRRNKDSMEFVIHYHGTEIIEDVAAPQINELYSLLRKRDNSIRKMSEFPR